jgi:phosphonate transport system ATP-binding protein
MTQPNNNFRLDDVTVCFSSVLALDEVSLSIQPGEQVALVGPSGAGKTTLLRLLNGTSRPTSGSVYVDGRHTGRITNRELRRLRTQIGFIHQDLSLVPNLRVVQNVLFGRMGQVSFASSLRMMLFPARRDVTAVHTILERVGIADKLYQRTDKLSGGQQQRVAIARALFQQPEAILADEPVSSVDPARAEDTVRLLKSISTDDGLTLCMSLHNLHLARKYFPRLIGMRNGRIVFDGAASELTDDAFQRLYQLTDEEMLTDLVEG